MFIQTEPTPNPDTLKFLPGQPVTGATGPYDFASIDEAGTSPLAQAGLQVIQGLPVELDGVQVSSAGSEFQEKEEGGRLAKLLLQISQ